MKLVYWLSLEQCFHFSVYVKQTVMLPVTVHIYTACTQVIRFSVDIMRNFSGGDEGSVDF
jgi:hypothetical protein